MFRFGGAPIMPIKLNSDLDVDFTLLRIQGRNVPLATFVAVDDGENISGGAQPGGGSNTSGSAGGNTLLTNAQNFSQIQEDPFPACVAHGSLLERAANQGEWIAILAQDLTPGMNLHYGGKRNFVERVDREWCDFLWFVEAQGHRLVCSGTHRIVTNEADHDGTAVRELKDESTWLFKDGPVPITRFGHMGHGGWVYRITLRGDDAPESHWFYANGGVSHNAKPLTEQGAS